VTPPPGRPRGAPSALFLPVCRQVDDAPGGFRCPAGLHTRLPCRLLPLQIALQTTPAREPPETLPGALVVMPALTELTQPVEAGAAGGAGGRRAWRWGGYLGVWWCALEDLGEGGTDHLTSCEHGGILPPP
jgi:hypothetical protein